MTSRQVRQVQVTGCGSYAHLTGQPLDAKDKRAAFLKEMVGLIYVGPPELDASA